MRIAQLVAAALALALALAFGLAARTTAAPPNSAPGGPILVITDSSNPFTQYYAEILRAEGLNEFDLTDISNVTAATLNSHDVAILGDLTPAGDKVTMLTDWVNGGGNLIAMRPAQGLGPLLGLSGGATSHPNGYLKVDTSSAPGTGIVGETIQYHGDADLWTPNAGTRKVATLFTGAAAAAETPNPAVTVRDVGPNGGQAAAFTFDLARSIVLTRQGNLDWEGQERDGFLDANGNTGPVRPNDLFFGNAARDPQPDWVDVAKIAIPQADEQQRLLANLIGDVTADRKPLPRFWYLPRDEKAAVVMTGDDHGSGGTTARFDSFAAASPAGCNVAAWECIRGTAYVYPDTSIPRASQFNADGFEIALHVTTNCSDYTTPAVLDAIFTEQLAQWRTTFPAPLPVPVSNRTHCVAWSDWASEPKVELAKGIRLDTNYYYWPGTWVGNRPGLFTGSGMPMRFADRDGSMIDVYQAATQMTDESGQVYPFTVNALLDRATGAEGYYGVFTANIHADSPDPSADAAAIVASAKSHDVPVVSSKQMLTWIDGRNDSSFGAIAWSGNALSFTVSQAAGANGLRGMLPAASHGGFLSRISRNGSPVSIAPRRIKGGDYVVIDALGGSDVATYGRTTPPVAGTGTSTGGSGAGTAAGSAAPAAGASKAASKTKSTAGCLTLTSSVKRAVKGRSTRLTVTVRKSGRAAKGVRVDINGAGAGILKGRTDSKGRARFTVRPRKTGSLRIRAHGQRASCKAPIVSVVAKKKKA